MNNMPIMPNGMAIRTQYDKIIERIIGMFFVCVVNTQYFKVFFISTIFTMCNKSSAYKRTSDTIPTCWRRFCPGISGFSPTRFRTVFSFSIFRIFKFIATLHTYRGFARCFELHSPLTFFGTICSFVAKSQCFITKIFSTILTTCSDRNWGSYFSTQCFIITRITTISSILYPVLHYIEGISAYQAYKGTSLFSQFKTFSIFEITNIVAKFPVFPIRLKSHTTFSTLYFHIIPFFVAFYNNISLVLSNVNKSLIGGANVA